jgi:ribose 5-phosphate isomerase A
LLREKIVAQDSMREIIVVDESKLSDVLGTRWAVPLEVVPFGLGANLQFLQSLGADVSVRKAEDGGDFWSDQGNLIVDAFFGPIKKPEELAQKLSARAGIIEHGLFLDVVTDVVIAGKNGIEHWQGVCLLNH